MNLSRQSDTLPKDVLKSKITVIGAGGIGSWTVLGLTKLGFTDIEVFDDDEIEDVNIPSQVYSHKQIGKKKVEGLNDLCKLLTETELTTHETRFSECKTSVLIVAVDNMETRKEVAEKLRDGKLFADFVIDARMAIESGIIQPYSFSTVKKYLETLYTDEQAVQEPCTNRAISYTTMIISGLICRTVISFLRDESKMTVNFNLKSSETENPEMTIFTKSLRVPIVNNSSLSEAAEFFVRRDTGTWVRTPSPANMADEMIERLTQHIANRVDDEIIRAINPPVIMGDRIDMNAISHHATAARAAAQSLEDARLRGRHQMLQTLQQEEEEPEVHFQYMDEEIPF